MKPQFLMISMIKGKISYLVFFPCMNKRWISMALFTLALFCLQKGWRWCERNTLLGVSAVVLEFSVKGNSCFQLGFRRSLTHRESRFTAQSVRMCTCLAKEPLTSMGLTSDRASPLPWFRLIPNWVKPQVPKSLFPNCTGSECSGWKGLNMNSNMTTMEIG